MVGLLISLERPLDVHDVKLLPWLVDQPTTPAHCIYDLGIGGSYGDGYPALMQVPL